MRARAAQAASAAAALDALFARTRIAAVPRPCCPAMPSGKKMPPYTLGWPRESQAAVNLCTRYCLALAACRAWALTQPDAPGVLGGLTQAERIRARAAARLTG